VDCRDHTALGLASCLSEHGFATTRGARQVSERNAAPLRRTKLFFRSKVQ
jgi:hypothetical protein